VRTVTGTVQETTQCWEIHNMRRLLMLVLPLLACLGLSLPANAVTNGTYDGNNHPYIAYEDNQVSVKSARPAGISRQFWSFFEYTQFQFCCQSQPYHGSSNDF